VLVREISDEALAALTGDRADDRLLVTPWLDGEPTWDEPLPVESWSVSWERSSQIQADVQLTIVDADGSLSPWAVDDVLGAGGHRVPWALRLCGVEEENMPGQNRITQVGPSEAWVSARRVAKVETLPGGQTQTTYVDE